MTKTEDREDKRKPLAVRDIAKLKMPDGKYRTGEVAQIEKGICTIRIPTAVQQLAFFNEAYEWIGAETPVSNIKWWSAG
jgi:hypothetical protein